MATTVKLKNSVTATNAPISLQQGEVAINITDKKVWVGNAATTPVQLLGTGANGSFTNLEYSGTFTGGTGVITIGTDQLYKDASGNFGLGTIVPASKLDIFTNATAGNLSALTFSANNTTPAKVNYVQFVPSIELNTPASECGGYVLKILQQGTYKDSIVAAGITNNSSNYLAFSTTNEAMRITSAGNVGIGTSTPRGIIDVLGSGTASTNNWAYIAGGNVGGVNPSANLNIGLAIGQNYSAGNSETNIVWGQGVGAGQYLAIGKWTGSAYSEQMRITSAGDVGIGTSSPSTYGKLAVAGSVANQSSALGTADASTALIGNFLSTAVDQKASLVLQSNSFSKSVIAGYYATFNGANDTGSGLIFATQATAAGGVLERMRIHASGGVSIGNTTDPSAGSLSVNNDLRFNSGYGSPALAYGCRAWVNFNGDAQNDQAGTYTQSGTTVIVTITGHGFTTGQVASLDFTAGTAVDGVYTVTVTDANVFTVVQASRITTGSVTSKRKTIRASGNVSSVTDNGTGDYSINFTTAMPDANYAVNASLDNGSTSVGAVINIDRDAIATPMTTQSVRLQCVNAADTPVLIDSEFVCVTIFR